MDFRDKRVVVTAAGRGIARRAVERYLDAGARVVASDVDEAGLASLKKAYPDVATVRADVGAEADVDVLFRAAEKGLGGLDILINAAGIAGQIGAVEDITAEGWRRCFAVNVDGAFYCARRAIPMLKAAGRGSIVNFSSMAGIYPYVHRSPYVAAKFAIIGLTKTLAMELGPHNINVNALCPGAVEGERMEEVLKGESKARGTSIETLRKDYTKYASMRTWISADEIVNMVMFVTSEMGHKVSGQALAVDGHTESFAG
jgi:NAD(P)-dependent dehydrogenase (short-subunit alcohol dehydrogenase family)